MNVDFTTFISSVLSAIGFIVTMLWWFGRKLIDHRFKKDFEKHKLIWLKELEQYKTSWQGEVKKDVETYLGTKAAEREYELEARKRLYNAIGPLRFQLLIACRDVASRIQNHSKEKYSMNTSGYYGRSSLYRLLRPLTISELIEEKIAYADFSIDQSAIALLQFKKSSFIAFTSGRTIIGHPTADWKRQKEHLFYDTLSSAARTLIINDDLNIKRCMHFSEFVKFLDNNLNTNNIASLLPLMKILDNFSIVQKPIFWIRLVCYGYICNKFIQMEGEEVGFEHSNYPLKSLVEGCNDNYFLSKYSEIVNAFDKIVNTKL